jgi:hypothetical protein
MFLRLSLLPRLPSVHVSSDSYVYVMTLEEFRSACIVCLSVCLSVCVSVCLKVVPSALRKTHSSAVQTHRVL